MPAVPWKTSPRRPWDFVFAVNCKGTFLFIKEVVRQMKDNGGGSIRQFLEQIREDRLGTDECLLGCRPKQQSSE